mmetsp:Transcript_9388/g.8872  ORF Transcript_9388/g.8872 Transcript_9388/m.8872 type:complete len:224 (+) Transcript_9388:1462-2133(+)
MRCPDGCIECEYDDDSCEPVCSDCKEGYTHDDMYQNCDLTCSEGMYYSRLYESCMYCPSGCYDCYEDPVWYDAICESCLDDHLPNEWDGTCELACDEGYYYNPDRDSCDACSSGCDYCFWNSYSYHEECEWCSDGYFYDWYNYECVEGCGEGLFFNEVTEYCEYCTDGCSSCYMDYEFYQIQCTDCWAGYIFDYWTYGLWDSDNTTYYNGSTMADGTTYYYGG